MTSTPGCAAGVSEDGQIVLERAYGMADLQHDVPNQPDTIFEAGSVSKQFTAAAVLLLVRDGVLELTQRPDSVYPLTPLYAGAFDSGIGTIMFRRNHGRVTELSVVQDRVWNLRFRRDPGAAGNIRAARE